MALYINKERRLMAKLHELCAVQSKLRTQSEATRNELKNTFEKKRTHFSEVIVTFKSIKENVADKEESRLGVQTTVHRELDWISEKIAKAIDASHQIDTANLKAKADVVLEGGLTLLKDIPATSLLQLEKRLEEVQDLVQAIPTLDPTKGFSPDPDRGADYFKARDVVKDRTEKVFKVLELAKATEKHQAVTEKYTVDEKIGDIVQQEWSSLITIDEKGKMLDRVEELIRAVKKARSRANDEDMDVRENKIGMTLLNYVFKGQA